MLTSVVCRIDEVGHGGSVVARAPIGMTASKGGKEGQKKGERVVLRGKEWLERKGQ